MDVDSPNPAVETDDNLEFPSLSEFIASPFLSPQPNTTPPHGSPHNDCNTAPASPASLSHHTSHLFSVPSDTPQLTLSLTDLDAFPNLSIDHCHDGAIQSQPGPSAVPGTSAATVPAPTGPAPAPTAPVPVASTAVKPVGRNVKKRFVCDECGKVCKQKGLLE